MKYPVMPLNHLMQEPRTGNYRRLLSFAGLMMSELKTFLSLILIRYVLYYMFQDPIMF
jgi:hypothetical protein